MVNFLKEGSQSIGSSLVQYLLDGGPYVIYASQNVLLPSNENMFASDFSLICSLDSQAYLLFKLTIIEIELATKVLTG